MSFDLFFYAYVNTVLSHKLIVVRIIKRLILDFHSIFLKVRFGRWVVQPWLRLKINHSRGCDYKSPVFLLKRQRLLLNGKFDHSGYDLNIVVWYLNHCDFYSVECESYNNEFLDTISTNFFSSSLVNLFIMEYTDKNILW